MIAFFFNTIFTHPAFPFATLLIGYLIGNYLTIGRDKRKEFITASTEFRNELNQGLVNISGNNLVFFNISGDIDKACYTAYLNFRPYLNRIYHHQYDKAWEQYCDDYKSQLGHIGKSLQNKLIKDIEYLLEFTEYVFAAK
jgi:hypothetical protein